MTERAQLPASAFTLADLRETGLSRGLVRRREVAHPFHGVHVVADAPLDLAARCAALGLVLDGRHVFSHVTAARLWGMPLPRLRDDGALHVMSVGERGRLRRPGVVGWETEAGGVHTTRVGALPVVAPADVWAQLAGMPAPTGAALSTDWLAAIGDFLVTDVRDRPALCSLADLELAAARRYGKRGVKRLMTALPLIRVGPQSPKESMLRLGLVRHGLPEPEVQVAVATADGIRHADLGYRRARLLLEYQGDHHRTSREQWREDLRRRQLFEDAGFHTIEVTDDDVWPDCRALAARVARLLAARENTRMHG